MRAVVRAVSPLAVLIAALGLGVVPTLVAAPCPVTQPNGSTPPGEKPGPTHHGNGSLWTVLWPNGTVFIGNPPGVVREDGSLVMKFPFWRGVEAPLSIEGHDLDAAYHKLKAYIPYGYGPTGFQASSLIFPNEGCWVVTAHAGASSLTFITKVVRAR